MEWYILYLTLVGCAHESIFQYLERYDDVCESGGLANVQLDWAVRAEVLKGVASDENSGAWRSTCLSKIGEEVLVECINSPSMIASGRRVAIFPFI